MEIAMTVQRDHAIKSREEELADKELKKLSDAQNDLQEKSKHLDILTSESLAKMKEVSKINHDLQTKVKALQELSTSLNRKNDELKRANQDLERKTNYNNQISLELKEKLERVLEKEKELQLQRDFLAKRLDETTQDLVKAEKFAII